MYFTAFLLLKYRQADCWCMRLEAVPSLTVNGAELTRRQLEALCALSEEGSQKAAAHRLGISTPVLHRYIHEAQRRAQVALLDSTPTGTRLTAEGDEIVTEYLSLRMRMGTSRLPVAGGTLVSEELLLRALSESEGAEGYEVIISTDERNLRDLRAGLMDIVVLDDPVHAMDLVGMEWDQVAEDRLLHVDRGERYGSFRFGAQRIGFRHLQTIGKQVEVARSYLSLQSLDASGLSYFVNESLAARKGLRIKSATDPDLLRHQIVAVRRPGNESLELLARKLRELGGH
jgi:DNA-binding transcriptional LysR family regulator